MSKLKGISLFSNVGIAERRSVYRPRYKCKNAKQAVGIYADDN